MIRVGILGCGKIADQHATHLRFMEGCRLVAVCDSDEIMARQLGERYGAEKQFTDARRFFEESRLDVVHITTPPRTHHPLGMMALEHGCNAYIEKPFTANASEAEELVETARSRRLLVTAGHNAQYGHAALEMRRLVGEGFLGGPPTHMECHFGYNLGDPIYAKALLADGNHWVRDLPGKLLQNLISHGISRIAEYFSTDDPTVVSIGQVSPMLLEIGEPDIVDELRVVISDGGKTTAYFTFTSQVKPVMHQFRLYGPQNSLVVDEDHETVIKVYGRSYKSYLNQFVPPMGIAGQYLRNAGRNAGRFLNRNFHSNIGMKFLIEAFYRAIQGKGPLPFTYREILLTTRIMDRIFEQVCIPEKGRLQNALRTK